MNRIVLNKLILCLAVASIFLANLSSASEAQQNPSGLDTRQENIAAISVLTATGNIDKLQQTLNQALNAGLTVNEIEEVLVHVYAYAGFPRSFNGMMTFMSVMDERQAEGIKDEIGKEASPIPADLNRDEYGAMVRAQLGGMDEVPPPAKWQKFSPVIDKFLKEHLFADLFARDILSFQDRELATVAVLASIPGLEGPLRFHLGAAMNTGMTEAQLHEFVAIIKLKAGAQEAETAAQLLREVLRARAK